MAFIQCANTKCPLNNSSLPKTFEWNETEQLEPGGQIVEPNTPGANSLMIKCPFCEANNIIWVTKLKIIDIYRSD
jgi:hypothetical protein